MAQAKEEKAVATQTSEASDFSSLLQKEFKPKSDRMREEVETAVRRSPLRCWRIRISSPTMRSTRSRPSSPRSTESWRNR